MSSFRNQLQPELAYLYEKAMVEVAEFENGIEAHDLSAKQVLRAHFCIAEYFLKEGSGIGGFGAKSSGLLLSALSRQLVGFDGRRKWTTVHEKAATLMFGLVMNHPFHDANKRTAYLSTIHYLYRMGFIMEATEKELEDLTVLVAKNGLGKFPRYRDLKRKSDDPEVEFISHFLKKNTRKIDREQYMVTYRELEKILKPYGVWLESPQNNKIDVMRWEEVEVPRRRLFGKPKKTKEVRRVCALGFPGWTKQIGKGRLKYLRKELGLTAENGVDSQSFFNGVDDMQVLLEMYEGALRRLADR